LSQLFAWVHLSDIHYGARPRSHALDKHLVLSRLKADLTFCVNHYGITPDVVVLTGDLAFSGGSSPEEYDAAGQFISDVLETMTLTPEAMLVVPGNHDVDLSGDGAEQLRRLLRSLREGEEALDDMSDEAYELLRARFAKYSAFAEGLGTQHQRPLARGGHWYRQVRPPATDIEIGILGLNTALLTMLRDNERHLAVGQAPLVAFEHAAFEEGLAPHLTMVLSHHPLNDEWLQDPRSFRSRLEQRADIELCGHVHSAATESARPGYAGSSLIRVVSGAAHGEASETGHGYSFGAILLEDAQLMLRVWPRLFYPGKQDFDVHTEILPRGSEYVDHYLTARRPFHATKLQSTGRERQLVSTSALKELSELLPQASEGLLQNFAAAAMDDVLSLMRSLAVMQRTPSLTAGSYYEFLIPLIDQAAPGSGIWAISTMMTVEWTDDPFEEDFLRANLQAAARGVNIERIFVVRASDRVEALNLPAVLAQLANPEISTWVAIRDNVARHDRELLSRIGTGIIAFDDDLVLVDEHSDTGEARGYGQTRPEEVARWRRLYRQIRRHATEYKLG